ncbi:YrrS family protein [uncultured Trichococcus sp.]|uniref:YrrS family protein n=1 Tax=uncultured Trichococcus sp. TaxID=189665 RepID=UPI002A1877BF|nr:YrrS family protein [uncultured Trichococcus sp.]
MSENNQKPTRQELHGNHKRNNLLVVLGVIAAAFLGLVLLYNIFYGNDEEPSMAANNQTNSQNMIITESDASSETSSSAEASSEKEGKEETDSETETEEVPSTDKNVTKAYNGDWEPIGTTQTGEHVTDYSDGSADRNEIKQAAAAATGISADGMIEWWVGNAGDQQVTATVSDTQKETIARVQLKWVDGEGWQVTLVEELDEIPNN